VAHGAWCAISLCLSFEGADAALKCNNGVLQMRNIIKSFLRDESGAAAAEYAMILAVVAIAIFVAAGTLGKNISTAIATAAADV
jgi:pilus assembly protein Flp/PilA